MFCPKCGTDAGNGQYCPNCGAAVDSQPFATNSQNYDPNARKVNKIAYGILAILVGDFGIHRFYAGKIWSGLLYLLFCWTAIPGILGLVEGIIALCREDDGHGNIIVDKDKFFV